jgi:hypothetical protein
MRFTKTRSCNGLKPRAEFAHAIFAVKFHRARTDVEGAARFLARRAFDDLRQNNLLSMGQVPTTGERL